MLLPKTQLIQPKIMINSGDEMVLPCVGIITSDYGKRQNPTGENEQFHKGVDIAVEENTPVSAVYNGVVTDCTVSKSYGVKLSCRTDNGYDIVYAHLNKILVKEGDKVEKGQTIALSGSTGDSTGPHLHIEISKNGESVNPKSVIKDL